LPLSGICTSRPTPRTFLDGVFAYDHCTHAHHLVKNLPSTIASTLPKLEVTQPGRLVHMAVVYRNSRIYIYRSVRQGGKVTSERGALTMRRRRKPPNRGGRPSKFTTDTADALAAALGRGQSIETAAGTAGVGISSAYRWVALGRSGDPRFATLAALADTARNARLRSPFRGLSVEFWRSCFES
jgi:hypothetical protein